jgi:hypothetical protein
LVHHLQASVKVADNAHQQDGSDPAEVRHAPAQVAADRQAQAEAETERACAQRAEHGWLGQVEGDLWQDAGELDQHRDQNEPEIVVVDDAAGEPGVVRREVVALRDRVQVGEVHRLLAAEHRVPQVRVDRANE